MAKWGPYVLNIFNFIMNNNEKLTYGVILFLLNEWQHYVSQVMGSLLQRMTSRNATSVMIYCGLGFDKMNKLNNVFKCIYNFRPFATQANIKGVIDVHRPRVDKFTEIQVKKSVKKNSKKKHKKRSEPPVTTVHFYSFGPLLGVSMNISGWINNNIYIKDNLAALDAKQIAVLVGSDRCDVDGMGCYTMSVVAKLGARSSSAVHATTPVVGFGSFKDNAKGLTHFYLASGLTHELGALHKLPAVITFVKWFEENGQITSRCSASCVLAFNTTTHTILNSKLKKSEQKLRENWLLKHPDLQIPHAENIPENDTNFDGWSPNKRNRMGFGEIGIKRNRDKQESYNWVNSLQEWIEHLQTDICPMDMKAVRGFGESQNQVTDPFMKDVIDKWVTRGLSNNANSDKPTLCDIKFTNSMSIHFSIYINITIYFNDIIQYHLYTYIYENHSM